MSSEPMQSKAFPEYSTTVFRPPTPEPQPKHEFREDERPTTTTVSAEQQQQQQEEEEGEPAPDHSQSHPPKRSIWSSLHLAASVSLLFLNYFCAQYDKFILSYFQDSFSESLSLSAAEYGVLSGYATGIVYALLTLPLAFLADYLPRARVWTLSAAAAWWSLCVVFQSLSRSFWQVLLARVGMGVGQSCVEALSVSLLSDLIRWRGNVFLGSSVFYVGVYIGEAVSGQIATAFPSDRDDGWRIALRAIGITGIVLAVLVRIVLRDPKRQPSVVAVAVKFQQLPHQLHHEGESDIGSGLPTTVQQKLESAKAELRGTLSYVMRTRSLWILVLSAGFRQLAGNVFGYYMPSYLANTYPDKPNILSRYGIIVGVVGSVAVLAGGALTSVLWSKTKMTPLYLTGIGGMVSSLFVLLMIFSRDVSNGDQDKGIKVLYSVMTLAYLTAEGWLGAMNGLVALLLPPRYKTYGLAIWSTIQVLIYSTGPQIIGLALRDTAVGSPEYTQDTQVVLAVIIPVCYWIAGVGFLLAIRPLRMDLHSDIRKTDLSTRAKVGVWVFAVLLVGLVIALFVSSIVYSAE